jgi:L-fuculose-phosphate aldolase
MASEREIRREIAAVCRRIYEKGLVAATDGNVSVRLDDRRILVTPSGLSKGDVTEQNVILCDRAGKKIAGELDPSSEIRLHLAVYDERSDVRAVVHAHPPVATAFTIAGVTLAEMVIPEVVVTLGTIPTAEYATPASAEGPLVIRKYIHNYDALLLDRHGTLTVGKTPWEAYFKLEKVEHAALIQFLARQMGNVRRLSPDELKRLVSASEQRGVTAKLELYADSGGVKMPGETRSEVTPEVVEMVTREVLKMLSGDGEKAGKGAE